jgi:N-acetylglucosaminyl-diphospho-decaprenol L-rhamnosyltransferase
VTSSPRIAVVIVSHQTRELALDCLASLADHEADEVVLVDTGSTDGTAAAVRADRPDVRVLELANAGFGRGANAGVRVTSSPTVVVANADVWFEPGCLSRLARELEEAPHLAAVGPAVHYPDGELQASARQVPDVPTAIGHAILGRIAPTNRWTRRYRELDRAASEPRDVDWLSGCALALRRDAFDAVGGFDPGYHLYVEDIDLGVRLRAAGWHLRFQPAASVEHRVGASTSSSRWRALTSHARGLDRFLFRSRHGLVANLLRPALWLGLTAWVVVTWLWERTLGARHSTTGERNGASR